jgi:hypothetical protein
MEHQQESYSASPYRSNYSYPQTLSSLYNCCEKHCQLRTLCKAPVPWIRKLVRQGSQARDHVEPRSSTLNYTTEIISHERDFGHLMCNDRASMQSLAMVDASEAFKDVKTIEYRRYILLPSNGLLCVMTRQFYSIYGLVDIPPLYIVHRIPRISWVVS